MIRLILFISISIASGLYEPGLLAASAPAFSHSQVQISSLQVHSHLCYSHTDARNSVLADTTKERTSNCLKQAAPLPACRTFLITETGVYYRLSPAPAVRIADQEYTHRKLDNPLVFTSDLGFMLNVNHRHALGAGHLFWINSEGYFRGGLSARLRSWVNPGMSFDLAAGFYLYSRDHLIRVPSLFGNLQLIKGKTFAVSLLADWIRYEPITVYPSGGKVVSDPWNDLNIHLGIKAGSQTGKIVHYICAGGALLLAVLISGSDG